MSGPVYSNGAYSQCLEAGIRLANNATIYSENWNPSSVATFGNPGDVFISTTTNHIYQKQDSGTTTNWTLASGGGSGNVSSVGMTVPSFLSVAGSPITTSGTLAVSLSGTALPVANGGTGVTSLGTLSDVGTDGITVTGGTGAVIGSGTSIAQHVADTTHNGYLSSTDWNTFNGKGSGSVTSVGMSVPSFLSIGGSPVTTSGTLAVTLSGTALPVTSGGTGVTSLGTLSDVGTDGITVTGGSSALISNASISQHVADTTHNGYLSSTDWNTFNGKQSSLTIGNLTDVGTDGITVTGGTGAVIGSSGTSIAQHVADTTHNGYLSSTDWNTFNGKQPAITLTGGPVISSAAGVITSEPNIVFADTYSGADLGAKINAADTALGSTAGTIVVPSGNYTIGTQIVLSHANRILEFGVGTYTLNASSSNGSNALIINADNVIVQGAGMYQTILIQATGLTNGDDIIRAVGGIYYKAYTTNPTIVVNGPTVRNLTIDGNRANVTPHSNDTYGNGINFNEVNSALVENCLVKNVEAQGICFANGSNPTYTTENNIIRNNIVTTTGEIGIGLEAYYNNVEIVDNVVHDMTVSATFPNSCTGIQIGGIGDTQNSLQQVIVSRNQVYNIPGGGLALQDAICYITISDNIFSNCGTATNTTPTIVTDIHSTAYANKLLIANNQILLQPGKNSFALQIQGLTTSYGFIEVIGNKIDSAQGGGILIGVSKGCHVSGNQITNVGLGAGSYQDGILLASCTTAFVSGNYCTAAAGYGINILSGSTTNTIDTNYLVGNTSGAYADAGTGTVQINNYDGTSLFTSKTLNLPSLSASQLLATDSSKNVVSQTKGNLTEATSTVLTITGGTGAIIGSGTTVQVKQANTSQSGYLSNTDWNTFNGKQTALTIGNLTDAGTDGITVTGGSGSVIGSGTSISQHVADTTHNGYLSSTDWNTFNGKGSGSVTSVAASVPAFLSVSGSPITTSGTLGITLSGTALPVLNGGTGVTSLGTLSDVGTDGITVTGGANSVISNVSLSQHVADTTHNGYLSSTDWNTFNNKQSTLTTGNLTDVGTDGITVTSGSGAVIGSGTSIAQHVADTTHNGYLSSTDWNTFNGKGSGSVTSVSVTTANGVSGSVATATTTPAITLTLGAITPTTVNKVTLTAPATGSTLTIADGKTLTASNSLTLTATDGSTLAIGAGGTLGSNAYTSTTYAPLASPTFTGTVSMPSGAIVTANSSGAYSGININNTASSNPYTQINFNNGTGTVKTASINYAPGLFFSLGPTTNDSTTPLQLVTNNTTGLSINGSSVVNIPVNTASTSTSTGSLTVAGGTGIAGNLVTGAATAFSGYDTSTATSGTITASANKPGLIITGAGGTTLTIKLPSSPIDGQTYYVGSQGAFTTVTWQDSGGTSGNVIGGQAALGGVNRGQRFVYSSAATKWFSI